jgi:hypothetical protein
MLNSYPDRYEDLSDPLRSGKFKAFIVPNVAVASIIDMSIQDYPNGTMRPDK